MDLARGKLLEPKPRELSRSLVAKAQPGTNKTQKASRLKSDRSSSSFSHLEPVLLQIRSTALRNTQKDIGSKIPLLVLSNV